MRPCHPAAVMMALAALVIQSCEHKELCYDHSHMADLRIDFDWSQAADAEPRTMVVRFFRPDGSLHVVRELTSTVSANVRIEAGEYMVIFHNGELESVSEVGDTYPGFRLSTKSVAILSPMGRAEATPPRPDHSRSEEVRSAPERVWAGSLEYIKVVPGAEGQSVTLVPREATSSYTIEVDNVENLTNDLDVSAALSGMSGSWSVAGGRPSGDAVTIPLTLERPDSHTLVARFHTFGHCHDTDNIHTFSVYTSNNVYYDFDITDKMHNAPNPHEVRIVIDGLKLPDPESSGLKPGVSDWDKVINEEIGMH